MTYFINLRSHPVGGWLDTSDPIKVQDFPAAAFAAPNFNEPSLTIVDFQAAVRGKHVLVVTHGFNVNFTQGVNALGEWSTLVNLPASAIFVGLLWPGDSVWLHGLDYPDEPRVADQAGERLAPFIEQTCEDAASVSFVSHSLGARVVLQTVNHLSRPVRRAILMAGAIDDSCLNTEFETAASRVERIAVLASKHDEVLALAFPLGNFVGGIIDKGHPWWHTALGRDGPTKPPSNTYAAPCELPDIWYYGHHHYLQTDPPYAHNPVGSVDVPPQGTPCPLRNPETNTPLHGWQQAWSAAFTRTRFQ